MKRVLFFAEAVTLAHLARPIVLARSLAGSRYEPHVACDARYDRFLRTEVANPLPLHSVGSDQFLQALAKGRPVYDLDTLRAYVAEDLALIREIRPALIVGDFRLSLSVSARLAGIPYAAITNAYWSPYYRHRAFPLPVLPMTQVLPVGLAAMLFRLGAPVAFPLHCRPLNRLRAEHGLPVLGNDLRRVYTDADHTLYADDPGLFPLDDLPATHRHLGPLPWSPSMPVPASWKDIDGFRPTVYLTLGSSGSGKVARKVFEAVAGLDVNLIAAGAGADLPTAGRANMFVSDYVPGDAAAARADLVICNGGSPTSQQALAAGVPVLGIAGNMDQFLNMDGLVRAGLGQVMRADRIRHAAVQAQVQAMLDDTGMLSRAAPLAAGFANTDLAARFIGVLDSMSGS